MNEQYVSWDLSQPGISFCLSSGRIAIFLRTLDLLKYPEFIRFLFNPDSGMFAVQICGMNNEGAKRLPIRKPDVCVSIKNKDLVRLVYSSRHWNPRISYRLAGEFFPSEKLVNFDLSAAYEIHEGRIKKPS